MSRVRIPHMVKNFPILQQIFMDGGWRCWGIERKFQVKFVLKFHKISIEILWNLYQNFTKFHVKFLRVICYFEISCMYFFPRENKKCPWKPFLAFLSFFFTSRKTFSRTLFSVFSRPLIFFTGTLLFFFFFTGKKNGFTGRNFFFPQGWHFFGKT